MRFKYKSLGRNLFCFIAVILLFGCNNATTVKNLNLVNIEENKIDLTEFGDYKLLLFYFASPDCPLSNEYSRAIKEFANRDTTDMNIKTFVVFCGKLYSKKEITNFMVRNKIEAETVFDTEYKLKNYLNASVTPEVFLVKNNFEVIYQGCIDNKYVSVKERRKTASEYYLADAIKKGLINELPKVQFTKPVGCFIE